jgi:hypothetical protein
MGLTIPYNGMRMVGYHSGHKIVGVTGSSTDGSPFQLTKVEKHPQQSGYVTLHWVTNKNGKIKIETEVIPELDLIFKSELPEPLEPSEPPKPVVCRRVPSKLGDRIQKRKALGLHACKSEGFLKIEKLLKCEEVLDDSRHY